MDTPATMQHTVIAPTGEYVSTRSGGFGLVHVSMFDGNADTSLNLLASDVRAFAATLLALADQADIETGAAKRSVRV